MKITLFRLHRLRMKISRSIFFLVTIAFLPGQCVAKSAAASLFNQELSNLNHETSLMCLHVEAVSLPAARHLKLLLSKAHETCPDYQNMEFKLINVEKAAAEHLSLADKRLHACQELSSMLASGVESVDSVRFRLKQGNYPSVTKIIDKWHRVFTEFGATSHLASFPIGVLREQSKVFYYDSYSEGVRQFLLTFFFPLATTTILTCLFLLSKRISGIIQFSRLDVIFPWLLIFAVALPVALVWNPKVTFKPQTKRYNWYPEATSAIEPISDDVDNFYSKVSQRIRSIEEIANKVNNYNSSTAKISMDGLIKHLSDALEQPTTEVIRAQRSCLKKLQIIHRMYELIEADAKDLGRSREANDTLTALKELELDFINHDQALALYLAYQKKVLPILMEHAASLRSLVQEGRLLELSQLLTLHGSAVLNISNHVHTVNVTLEYVFDDVDNDQTWGLKRSIISLNDKSVQEQLEAMVLGSLAVGAGAISGVLTVKGALAIVTIGLPAVAIPVGLASVASCAFFAKAKLRAYNKETQFMKHLEALEIERGNLKAFLETVKNATEARTRAIKSSREHIHILIDDLKDDPVFLGPDHANLLLKQMNKLIDQYHQLNAVDSLFTPSPVLQDQVASTT